MYILALLSGLFSFLTLNTDGGDGGGEPTGGEEGGEQTPAPDGDPNAVDDDPAGDRTDKLPKWARDAITRANSEAAGFRTQLREFQQQQDERTKAFARALGLESDEPPKPEELQRSIADKDKELESASSQVRNLKAQVMLTDAIVAAGANPRLTRALLVSENALNGVDPDEEGAYDKISSIVKQTLQSNPELRTGQAPPRSGGDFSTSGSGGQQGKNGPVTLDDALANINWG